MKKKKSKPREPIKKKPRVEKREEPQVQENQEENQPQTTGPTSEPAKTQEENADMTLTSKKEREAKKEPLKIDGKEVRSVYEFKDYFIYDFVEGGRKKVMKKDAKE